jgi:hypothetical protein
MILQPLELNNVFYGGCVLFLLKPWGNRVAPSHSGVVGLQDLEQHLCCDRSALTKATPGAAMVEFQFPVTISLD